MHSETLPNTLDTNHPGAWAQRIPKFTCAQSHRFASYLNAAEDLLMWTGHARLIWIQTLWFSVPSASPVTGNDLLQGKGPRGLATAPPGLPCPGADTGTKGSTLFPPRGLMPTALSPLASPTTPSRRRTAPPPVDIWTNMPGIGGTWKAEIGGNTGGGNLATRAGGLIGSCSRQLGRRLWRNPV